MSRIFAERAWLGPGQFAERVLIEFDSVIRNVSLLGQHESPPGDAEPVQWLTPGFINAHCHLEYSWLGNTDDDGNTKQPARKLPRGDVPFGQWMQAIIAASPISDADLARQSEAMRTAARDLVRGGCTTVLDSTTDGSSATPLSDTGIHFFLFHEVLGLSRPRAQAIWENVQRYLKTGTSSMSPLFLGNGINPHAPYSVGSWLREKLLTDELRSLPQAWHLGETEDEDELFQSGTGSIAEFLRSNQMPMPYGAKEEERQGSEPAPPGVSTYQFLRRQNLLDRCSVAFHANSLKQAEAASFAREKAIVHCPGTHRWFSRKPVPLKEWLHSGVNVCLGTDSLASAETLSMLDVIRMAVQDNPAITADDALTMACTNPAGISFLKEKGLSGRLRREEPADFVALKTRNKTSWRSCLSGDATVAHTWVAGCKH